MIPSRLLPSSGVGQPTIGRPFYGQAKGLLSPAGRQPFERSEVGLFSDGRKPGYMVFAAKGGIKNSAEGRCTSPAQRYYITPEGGSPQPACKAKPITGRTLGAQGQRPGGAINPHARKGVLTFGNTGKHRPGHGPDPYPSSLPSWIFSIRVWYLSSVDRWPTLMTVI